MASSGQSIVVIEWETQLTRPQPDDKTIMSLRECPGKCFAGLHFLIITPTEQIRSGNIPSRHTGSG